MEAPMRRAGSFALLPVRLAVPSAALRAVFSAVLVAAIALVLSTPLAARAASNGGVVVVAKVDGSIDGTLAGYLRERLDEAESSGATLVLQLDSAGTLDQDAVALARRVFDATVPVVVWVGPAPAKARGAALLLLSAASLPAVAPGAGVGPLEPVDLVDARNAALPGRARLEALAATWARERGRAAPTFPEAAVPARAAIEDHLAEVAAPSLPDLLSAIDGLTVSTADGQVTLRTRIAQDSSEPPVDVRFTDLGPVGRVLHAMASPSAIYLLLVAGFAALAFELTQPGFGFAGFSGAAMLALAVYGLAVVPFSWVGLLVLVAGVGLLMLDVVRRALGPRTAVGLVAFLVGSLLTFRGVSPEIDVSPWLAVALTVASLLYYGFALTVALQSRDRITSTQRGLVGLAGETRGELTPEGPVFVKGALWRGRSIDGPIEAGTRVRVRGVDGLILRVEPDPGRSEPGSSSR
jgi:membrane-bound serine protease (ClpP class)